jgi:hypothetical protein
LKKRIDDDFAAFRLSIGDAALRDLCGELDATELAKSPLLNECCEDNKLPLVIWFQCPWTYRIAQGYSTAELLSMFIKSASTSSPPGGIVLVLEVVSMAIYSEDYRIQDVIREAQAKGFKHVEDKCFIRECMLSGYPHCF